MARKTLLVVEDDSRLAELVRYMLGEDLPDFDVEVASRLSSALAALVRHDVAGIISDLNLPDSTGADTVRHLRRAAPNAPLIVMTSESDFDLALRCVEEGADEFVVKGTIGLHAVGHVIRLALERHRRLRLQWSNPEPADAESGGPATFESVARYLIGVADRAGLHIAVIVLHLEPRPGGSPADAARLAMITEVLRRSLRRCDVVARLDAHELGVVLVMQQPDSRDAVTRLARELAVVGGDPPVQLGVASYHSGGTETFRELLGQAQRDLQPLPA